MAWKPTAALAVLALVLVPTALAGGGKSSSSISLAPLVSDTSRNGQLNWGDTVTFNVSTTATTQPWVNLQCFQNGVLVAQGWDAYFAGALSTSRDFVLSSPAWTGGAADCTAWLDMYTKAGWKRLASTTFHVSP